MRKHLLHAEVLSKLYTLRRAIRARLLAEGVSYLLMALTGVVAVTLAFDYLMHLPAPARGIVMGLSLLAAGWIVWKHLLRPMTRPMSLESLALLAESHYRQLDDRLISALQFGLHPSRVTDSPAMIEKMADEVNELARPMQFRNIVEMRKMVRTAALALATVLLLAGFSLWRSDIMRLWLDRNLAFADTPWPQDVYLSVGHIDEQGRFVPGVDFSVLRGDDLELYAKATLGNESAKLPPNIRLHATYQTSGKAQELIELADHDAGLYRVTFRSVNEPLEFYITGGDDRLDRRRPHQVNLIEPPAVSSVQFVLHYPQYMKRTPDPIDGERGGLVVPVGTTVRVQALANKDLAEAEMILRGPDGETKISLHREAVDIDGQLHKRKLTGSLIIAPSLQPRDDTTVLPPRTLTFRLVDTDGFASRRGLQYRLDIRPDVPPEITLSRRGVGSMITDRARIPMPIEIRDDCGVASYAGQFQVITEAGEGQFVDGPVVQTSRPAPGKVETLYVLDLQPLGVKRAAKGQTDMVVRLRASDILPAEAFGGPNRTVSHSVLRFRIVADQVLMDDLVSRQRGVRTEFLETQRSQVTARAKTEAARKAQQVRQNELLSDASNLQQSVGSDCGRFAEVLGEILAELQNNRLGTAEARQRLEGDVIAPLRLLAQESTQLQAELNGLAATGSSPSDRYDRVLARQADMLKRMDAILERMEKLASLQEALYRAEMNLKELKEIQARIKAYLDAQVGTIFDDQPTDDDPGQD